MQFKNIIGQQAIKNRLIQSVQNERLPHAQLFYEHEGSGGLALAVAYAQYANCLNPGPDDSCGTCSACHKINKLIHPDIHFAVPTAADSKREKLARTSDYAGIWQQSFLNNPYLNLNDWFADLNFETNKQLFLSVEESADIIKKLSYKNFEARYKFCIIWCPEKWNTSAANALLKLIEEPPPATIFILVTEHYDQIISTILSRTQLVKIPRLTQDELITVLQAEQIPIEKQASLIHLSNGSYRLLQDLMHESQDDNYATDFLVWMRLCFNPIKTYAPLLNWIEGFVKKKREQQKHYFAFCMETCRECLLINYADTSMVRFTDNQFKGLSAFAPYINQNNASEFVQLFSDALYHIDRNANAKIMLLDLSFKIAKLMKIR
ncbi:MAG: DNA polymerase III subunit delta [Bacteroidia bacterium]|nr:DNA polymerase III subunit delta [Bacteroidia bacterium]